MQELPDKHKKVCTFKNQHRCQTQGSSQEDLHNQLLCPQEKEKRSVAAITIDCDTTEPELLDVLTILDMCGLEPNELFSRVEGDIDDERDSENNSSTENSANNRRREQRA